MEYIRIIKKRGHLLKRRMTKKQYRNEKQIGIIISYITTFASLIIGVIYTPMLLRLLGQGEYGVYQIVGSIV